MPSAPWVRRTRARDVLMGVVGEAPAIEFLGYAETTMTETEVLKILDDPAGAALPQDLGQTYALVSYIAARATDAGVLRAAGQLLGRLQPEFAVLMTRDLIRISPGFVADPGYVAFVQEHQELIS